MDLNEQMIKRKSSTFFVTAEGGNRIDAGIHDGDIVIVDKSIKAKHGHIVVALIMNLHPLKKDYRKIMVET